MDYEQLKTELLTDPRTIISIICTNNPEGVYRNFAARGINTNSDPDSLYKSILKLSAQGKTALIKEIIKVPINTGTLPQGYQEALEETKFL